MAPNSSPPITIEHTNIGVGDVEIVERKGLGHPDTIADSVAEEVSRALSRYYLNRFGDILHHNVDKVLVRGGAARAQFGGGDVLAPIDIFVAGRATTEVNGVAVPVEELTIESTRAWIRQHMHALDPVRHVRVQSLVRAGSADLTALFMRRGNRRVALANDTSFGIGFAPLRPLERLVLELERDLNQPAFIRDHPAHGEDVKVMAVRHGEHLLLVIARAFIAAHCPSLEAYLGERQAVESMARRASGHGATSVDVIVNGADATDGSSVYLTVTGTSAESGDDGEVGRGNRANGLITPFRPMSLEALAGKNAVSHAGKVYNVAARSIAERLVAAVPSVRAAECYLVSRIGAPIDQPALTHVRVDAEGDCQAIESSINDVVRAELARVPTIWHSVLDGSERLF